jgi:hypothetical protein
MMRPDSAAGTSGRNWFGVAGVSEAAAIKIAMASGPRNGACPVQARYSTAPRAYRSLRASTGRPRACSGAM